MAIIDTLSDQLVRLLRQTDAANNNLAIRLTRAGTYRLINQVVGLAIPFARRNHFKVDQLGSGYLRASISLKGNRNHIGTLYAGAQFLLAEIPGGVLTITEFGSDYYPVLKELTMTYLKPAKSDISVEFSLPAEQIAALREQAKNEGKAEFTMTGELKDKRGEIVARSLAHYQIRKK